MRRVILAAVLAVFGGAGYAADLPRKITKTVYPELDLAEVAVGQLLFFDPILSGNKNISCATCHQPELGTTDAMSLSFGEGAIGIGPARGTRAKNRPPSRLSRNTPSLFNIGARDYDKMFADGRVHRDLTAAYGMRLPDGLSLTRPVDNVLAAQALLPLITVAEMAGHPGENPVADAVERDDAEAAWSIISQRVDAIDGYRHRFREIIGDRALHVTDIANAISAYVAFEFRSYQSLFDTHLDDATGLSGLAMVGRDLFYGKAGCSGCHSGPFLTDQDFHAIAMPQIGPGTGYDTEKPYRDLGRMEATGDPDDAYKFKTPSLRNVGLTAPYGHSGAFASLEDIIRHHLDPVNSLMAYDRAQVALQDIARIGADDWQAMDDPDELAAIANANELAPVSLPDHHVTALVEFLRHLTDPINITGRLGGVDRVPSGLAVDRLEKPGGRLF